MSPVSSVNYVSGTSRGPFGPLLVWRTGEVAGEACRVRAGGLNRNFVSVEVGDNGVAKRRRPRRGEGVRRSGRPNNPSLSATPRVPMTEPPSGSQNLQRCDATGDDRFALVPSDSTRKAPRDSPLGIPVNGQIKISLHFGDKLGAQVLLVQWPALCEIRQLEEPLTAEIAGV
jgi:hypothetical protein